MKILVVEDEKDLNNLIVKFLKKNNISADSALDGKNAMYLINNSSYDLILLDIMIPEINGYEIIKNMREYKDKTPIIIITARDSIEDRIKGLDLGADDYLIKPFNLEELSARIRAINRRKYEEVSNILQIDDLILDVSKKTVTRSGTLIDLTAKEYEILLYLLENKNRIISREQIRNHVWDFYYESYSNTIDVIIKNIRKKINLDNAKQIIHTKRGLGYVIKEN